MATTPIPALTKFDAKIFNPQAFGKYMETIPQLKKNEFLKAGILTGDANVRQALSNQTGTYTARIPMYGLIDGDPINYDGETDITATATKTYHQDVVVVGRAKAWTEKDFSEDITGRVGFMDNIARQISHYWDTVDQNTILAILEGIYKMSTGNSNKDKEFVDNHTLDITGAGTTEDPGVVGAATLNTAIQKASGDNKNIFTLAIMHSVVATNLENLKVLSYAKYNDTDGLQRDVALATWNGRTVIIDDSVPTGTISTSGSSGEPGYIAEGTSYTTYLFGQGAFIYEDLGAEVPYEMHRDPKTAGGLNTLYTRQRKVFAPRGISFTGASLAKLSPTDAELKEGANWTLINDGANNVINHKSIAIARIISRG